jgi:hypothetical protein
MDSRHETRRGQSGHVHNEHIYLLKSYYRYCNISPHLKHCYFSSSSIILQCMLKMVCANEYCLFQSCITDNTNTIE